MLLSCATNHKNSGMYVGGTFRRKGDILILNQRLLKWSTGQGAKEMGNTLGILSATCVRQRDELKLGGGHVSFGGIKCLLSDRPRDGYRQGIELLGFVHVQRRGRVDETQFTRPSPLLTRTASAQSALAWMALTPIRPSGFRSNLSSRRS